MADGKQWFKVWASILIDPGMEDLHNQDIGIWTRLGALVAAHGEKGTIKISLPQFLKRTHLTTADNVTIQAKINTLKTINCDIVVCNESVTVTFKKWHKYQVDNSTERVAKYRQNVTVQEEKRREEKRRDKNKKRIHTPIPPQGFELFWDSYPRKIAKQNALKAWLKVNPDVEKIMAALEVQKDSEQWRKDGGQFIPHPATWLNGRRWEDEIKEESWREAFKD